MGEHARVEAAVEHVVRVDPAFGRVVEAVGPFAPRPPQADAREIADALALFREVGDSRSVGATLWAMGLLALEHWDLQRARLYFEESLDIGRRHASKQGIGFALLGAAILARSEGAVGRALALLKQALPLFKETGNPGVYDALSLGGELAVWSGQMEPGVRLIAAGVKGGPSTGRSRRCSRRSSSRSGRPGWRPPARRSARPRSRPPGRPARRWPSTRRSRRRSRSRSPANPRSAPPLVR